MDVEVIGEISNSAQVYVSWSISILGTSILAIVSTSYLKPEGKWGKLIYLLFIPGWGLLINTIYLGSRFSRRLIMAVANPTNIPEILDKMNEEYGYLLCSFIVALVFFCLWLILFLLFWIFKKTPKAV